MQPKQRIPEAVRAALFLAPLLVLAGSAAAAPPPTLDTCDTVPVADPEIVSVETPLGTMRIETYSNVAPQTVANFLGYIARGDYHDSLVHRITRDVPDGIDVIQMGGFRFSAPIYEAVEAGPTLVNEPCILNVAGTVAMAKLGGQPDSATSQWFVNVTDNAPLDNPLNSGGFAVFGRLIDDSLDVAVAIQALTDSPPDDVIPPYFAGVEGPLWSLFQASPLTAPLVDDPASYGCFDVDQSGVLLVENPTGSGSSNWVPNPELGLAFTLVSYACTGDAGSGAGEPLPCQDPPGRRMLDLDPAPPGTFIQDPNGEFNLAEHTLSCSALDESLASYAARIADIGSQLDATFVKTSYTVPEAGAGVSALAALLSLAALRRRSPRGR